MPVSQPSNAQVVLLGASASPVQIYGASGAAAQVAATVTIKANSLVPDSLLEIDLLCSFPAPSHAGRTVVVKIGSTNIGSTFPTASMLGLAGKIVAWVAPDLQSLTILTQNINNSLSPSSAGTGAPYSVQAAAPTVQTIDFTVDQTLTIQLQPINDDIAELTAFSVKNIFAAKSPGVSYAPANAVVGWGDSLTAGTGSLGSFILNTTASTTSGSNALSSVGSTTGVLPGQLISGPGIPAGTIVTGTGAGTITMSANATASAAGVAVAVKAGSWPRQLLYASAGRPVTNLGVGGQTSGQILTRMLRDKVRGRLWTAVLWLGRNDVGGGSLTATVMANLASAVGNLAAGVKYLVGTVIPAANEGVGSTNWNAIVALNTAIAAAYPSNLVDLFAALTNNGSQNVRLKYRASTNTTATGTSGTNTITVASAAGLSTGMYAISPGSSAISDGAGDSAPTITNIAGTTITLSANLGASISSAMVSFVAANEVHLNDLGYQQVQSAVSSGLLGLAA